MSHHSQCDVVEPHCMARRRIVLGSAGLPLPSLFFSIFTAFRGDLAVQFVRSFLVGLHFFYWPRRSSHMVLTVFKALWLLFSRLGHDFSPALKHWWT